MLVKSTSVPFQRSRGKFNGWPDLASAPHPQPLSPRRGEGSKATGTRSAMKRPIPHTPARSAEAIQFARDQRSTANEFVQTVWQWIRNRQICNQKFRREFPIPPYTADFCCVELKLILELDGAGHVTEPGREHDRIRDDVLTSQGYRVMRIAGYDVLREPEMVLERIESFVRQRMEELRVT
jgi:very-short-patch-repair endonuclease